MFHLLLYAVNVGELFHVGLYISSCSLIQRCLIKYLTDSLICQLLSILYLLLSKPFSSEKLLFPRLLTRWEGKSSSSFLRLYIFLSKFRWYIIKVEVIKMLEFIWVLLKFMKLLQRCIGLRMLILDNLLLVCNFILFKPLLDLRLFFFASPEEIESLRLID